MLLQGRRIIVTGGVASIGKAIVLACVREGATVVFMSHADAAAVRVTTLIDAAGELGPGPIRYLRVDIGSKEAIDRTVERAVDWLGGLDALIHCTAGEKTRPAYGPATQDFREQLNSVLGTAFVDAAAFRHMREVGGAIVNNTSEAGLTAESPNPLAASAAKGGIVGYSRAIANECRRHQIRINVVAPAEADPYLEDLFVETPQERDQASPCLASITPPAGRMPTLESVADVNVFLASDLSRGISGQLITVDGSVIGRPRDPQAAGSHTKNVPTRIGRC